MLEPFLYMLRAQGLKVSTTEWLALQEALAKGQANSSLSDFYYLARALLVKSEEHFDLFDRTFVEYFKDFTTSDEMLRAILAGLKEAEELNLSDEELALLKRHSLEELLERFRKKFEEGHFDQHVGGSEQIGTGGRSPTGDLGDNPQGLRIGEREQGRHKRAIQVATRRRFRDLAGDHVLDTRQIQAALRRIRSLLREGPEDVLNLERTIDATARNAGEIDLVFEAERRNKVRVALFIDVGGSMDVHAALTEKVFSAAKGLFRRLDYYYFHNCIYQEVWKSFGRNERMETEKVLRELDPGTKTIIVGDAAMALSELLARHGSIDYFSHNDVPGIRWLERLREALPNSVWLNPEPHRYWEITDSIRYVRRVFPMFELTLEGLEEASRHLMTSSGRRVA